ncbi:MAG: AbrB/MazE/SpoVT family DNA-binding domain-containing protein [Candidatus Omnitrophica bacterium]|nr:AbrB/MazE/SpoVT family DNA-binding domain-containing protein [Candidatus Omnitrophota bacterium]
MAQGGVYMQAIFRGKAYGAVTVGERGQLVIPAQLRKEFNINPGDQLMVFAKPDKKVISLMHAKDFAKFLEQAARMISKLERKIDKK